MSMMPTNQRSHNKASRLISQLEQCLAWLISTCYFLVAGTRQRSPEQSDDFVCSMSTHVLVLLFSYSLIQHLKLFWICREIHLWFYLWFQWASMLRILLQRAESNTLDEYQTAAWSANAFAFKRLLSVLRSLTNSLAVGFRAIEFQTRLYPLYIVVQINRFQRRLHRGDALS